VSAATVTTEATQSLLIGRLESLRRVPVEVVPQGFHAGKEPVSAPVDFRSDILELLFTGTLYAGFRSPAGLLEAMRGLEGVRLTLVGHLEGMGQDAFGPNVRFLGRLPHAIVREAQRRADVLVNIGNDDNVQIPGKLFEYLGAARPVLHLSSGAGDPSAALLAQVRRGHVVPSRDALAIRKLLQAWAVAGRSGPEAGVDLGPGAVEHYAWPRLAEQVERLLLRIVPAPHAHAGPLAAPARD
jgi:hypothetical protein